MALDWYTTLMISSWDDFQREYESQFALRGRRWVFRGQQDTRWDLKPSLERSACDRVGLSLTELPEIEAYLLTRFQRNLHRFQARVPASNDHLEWLALMQHHGAPTRLLDWTYSCYIALFFALELAPLDTTCAVWAIDQIWLFRSLKELSAEGVREAFKLDPELRGPRSAHTLLTTKGVTSVAPLVPYHLSERLAVQQGVFLVPLNLEVSFMENLRAVAQPPELRDHILKLEIPVVRKVQYQMLVSLERLNVHRLSLFPGIDGFAQSMQLSPLWWHPDSYRE
jgi:hypothetical protein